MRQSCCALLLVVVAMLLPACGGGSGGSSPTAPPPPTATNVSVTIGPIQDFYNGGNVTGAFSVQGGPSGDLEDGRARFEVSPGTYTITIDAPGFLVHKFRIEVPSGEGAEFGPMSVFESSTIKLRHFDEVSRSVGRAGSDIRDGTVRFVEPPTFYYKEGFGLEPRVRQLKMELAEVCHPLFSRSRVRGWTDASQLTDNPRLVLDYDPTQSSHRLSSMSNPDNSLVYSEVFWGADQRDPFDMSFGYWRGHFLKSTGLTTLSSGSLPSVLVIFHDLDDYSQHDRNWCQALYARPPGARSPDDISHLDPLQPESTSAMEASSTTYQLVDEGFTGTAVDAPSSRPSETNRSDSSGSERSNRRE